MADKIRLGLIGASVRTSGYPFFDCPRSGQCVVWHFRASIPIPRSSAAWIRPP